MFFAGFRDFWGPRGGNRTGYRLVPTSAQAAPRTIGLILPWNLAFPEMSYAPKIKALGEPCASIVIRLAKHDFLKCSTPDILKLNFFVVFRGKTHSAAAFLNLENIITE